MVCRSPQVIIILCIINQRTNHKSAVSKPQLLFFAGFVSVPIFTVICGIHDQCTKFYQCRLAQVFPNYSFLCCLYLQMYFSIILDPSSASVPSLHSSLLDFNSETYDNYNFWRAFSKTSLAFIREELCKTSFKRAYIVHISIISM